MILSFTTACPNERVHPVLKSMASSNECSSLGGPYLQSSSSDQQGCEDNSTQIMDRRKQNTRTRGTKNECSFEDKISGSLDAALDKLFNNYWSFLLFVHIIAVCTIFGNLLLVRLMCGATWTKSVEMLRLTSLAWDTFINCLWFMHNWVVDTLVLGSD